MYRVLVVEDDRIIAQSVCDCLAGWGYEACSIKDFDRVMEEFAAFLPHLVLLDISLPFYNGYHWCRQIRKVSPVPIAFLSSADDNMNIVMAMNLGADDFIAKPFDLTVLAAKVQALLRRAYSFGGQAELVEFHGAMLNLGDATLVYEGRRAELTRNEVRILQCLLENRGKTVGRDTLMRRLWEDESFIDDNTLTVNVTRLRKKLKDLGLGDIIATKKGLGYLMED